MNKEIIKYNIKKLKRIKDMEDFYKKIGLFKKIQNKEITNVNQIHMNKENCEKLCDYIKSNARKNKNIPFAKTCTQKYLDNICGMDWLMYSPDTSIKDIPKNEIWITKES